MNAPARITSPSPDTPMGDAPMTDRQASELEVQAALGFWREFHTAGARRRVLSAIAYYRRWHS